MSVEIKNIDVVIQRVKKNRFRITIGELEIETTDVTAYVGDLITIPIKSVLVLKNGDGKEQLVNILPSSFT